MVQNRIILSLAAVLGCVTNAVTSPIVLPIVDLRYAIHQASLNKVSPSCRMKDDLDICAEN